MNDELNNLDVEQPVKRKPGRPRKVAPPIVRETPKAPKQWVMKAKQNWDDIDPVADDSPDRLRIDPSLVPEGMSLQWVTDSVYGQSMAQHRANFEKRGWTPVHQEDFAGVYDGMFMPRGRSGEINVDGMVLMARPEEFTRRARMEDRRKANEKIRIKEQQLRGGDIGTSLDSQHPSALQTNKINKSMERIEIPEDR